MSLVPCKSTPDSRSGEIFPLTHFLRIVHSTAQRARTQKGRAAGLTNRPVCAHHPGSRRETFPAEAGLVTGWASPALWRDIEEQSFTKKREHSASLEMRWRRKAFRRARSARIITLKSVEGGNDDYFAYWPNRP